MKKNISRSKAKNQAKPILIILSLLAMILFISCGKKTDTTATTAAAAPAPSTTSTTTTTVIDPAAGSAPLSFEFTEVGNSGSYTTPPILTDNTLMVRFKVGSDLGNSAFQAQWLKVTIAVNGNEVSPTYTANNYLYGEASDGNSNIIDFSANITPGVPVTITVKNPWYDFYCIYPYNNPLYGTPGCLKPVLNSNPSNNPPIVGHDWSGTLLVQTSSTTAI